MTNFYQSKNFLLMAQRLKTPFAEVDLVFKSEDEIILVEVKSCSNMHFVSHRVGKRQKERLRNALRFFQSQYEIARLELAVVSQKDEVLIFTDVF